MSQLPKNWIKVSFDTFMIECNQRVPEQNEEFKYIDISSVNRDTKRVENPQVMIGKDAPSRARKHIKSGDVLVSMTRPNLNAVALVPDELNGQIASTGFDVLRTSDIDPRWIFNLVRTNNFVEAMSALVQGALYPAVRSKDIRGFVAPFAPLNEQKRIADKLDSILVRVDACRERLDRIPAILKRFRQSILAAATSGKLTEEWRTNQLTQQSYRHHTNQINYGHAVLNSVQLKKSTWVKSNLIHNEVERVRRRLNKFSIDFSTSDNLPDNWCWAKLEDVSLFVVDCHNKTAPYERTGIALVRTSNIRDGHFIWDDLRYVSEATYKYWSKRCYPEGGDIVFTREAPLGEAAIIPVDKKICLGQRTMLIRTVEEHYLAKFLLISLMDQKFKSRSEEVAVGTGVKHFRVGDVSDLLVPVPSTEEQTEIVRRVEELFAYADRIEARYQAARAQVDKLTPAILAKAFRGELVPQDPSDEPASALLERIQASRAEVAVSAKPKRSQNRNLAAK